MIDLIRNGQLRSGEAGGQVSQEAGADLQCFPQSGAGRKQELIDVYDFVMSVLRIRITVNSNRMRNPESKVKSFF